MCFEMRFSLKAAYITRRYFVRRQSWFWQVNFIQILASVEFFEQSALFLLD